jgi:hypothetical protein
MKKDLLFGKNHVPNELMTIFQHGDRYERTDLYQQYDALDPEREASVKFSDMVGYIASVGVLRRRLELMGFAAESVRVEAARLIQDLISDGDRYFPDPQRAIAQERFPNGSILLDEILVRFVRDGWAWLERDNQNDLDLLLRSAWEEVVHDDQDSRFVVALLLTRFRSNSLCRLNLTDLLMGGWLDWSDDLISRADAALKLETSISGKIIVLTEGSTDSIFLRAALTKLFPEVSSYFTFLDFGSGAPGGASWVVNLARGLAGAAVMNRVVVVLDNDAAGREAERQLQKIKLPPTFAVMRLPDQPFAARYPTLGPSGPTLEDVNGRAGAIEFMFGPEILATANGGSLPPVRFKAYIESVGEYQGELMSKTEVQKAISRLVRANEGWPAGALRASRRACQCIIAAANQTLDRPASRNFE